MSAPGQVAVCRDDWDDSEPVSEATTHSLVVRVAAGVQLRNHLWNLLRHSDYQSDDHQADLVDLRVRVQSDIAAARAELRARHAPTRR